VPLWFDDVVLLGAVGSNVASTVPLCKPAPGLGVVVNSHGGSEHREAGDYRGHEDPSRDLQGFVRGI